MSVPNRRECIALLLSLDPPSWHLRHSCAVAETAAWLALRARRAGRSVDRRLVEAAALLHDVDKLPTVSPAIGDARHADGSAAWLAARGWPELGPVVAGHPVTRLGEDGWLERWLATASPEALIVSYADKRAGQRLETMAERFASWSRRYPPAERARRVRGTWTAGTVERVRRRSEEIERRTCELAGVSPDQVRRLRWTRREIAAVERAGDGVAATGGRGRMAVAR
jgi:hypothetical protein